MFKGNGKTGSIEYAWLVFYPGQQRRHGKIVILDETPKAERLLA